MNKKIIQQIRLHILLFVPVLLFPAATLHAQQVRVTIREHRAKMERVISAIEHQTRYLFGIGDDVNTDRLVTVELENAAGSALDDGGGHGHRLFGGGDEHSPCFAAKRP